MTAFNCFFDRIRLARMFSVLEGIFVPESIGTGYGEELVSAFALVVGGSGIFHQETEVFEVFPTMFTRGDESVFVELFSLERGSFLSACFDAGKRLFCASEIDHKQIQADQDHENVFLDKEVAQQSHAEEHADDDCGFRRNLGATESGEQRGEKFAAIHRVDRKQVKDAPNEVDHEHLPEEKHQVRSLHLGQIAQEQPNDAIGNAAQDESGERAGQRDDEGLLSIRSLFERSNAPQARKDDGRVYIIMSRGQGMSKLVRKQRDDDDHADDDTFDEGILSYGQNNDEQKEQGIDGDGDTFKSK